MSELDPEAERAWTSLRRHLERSEQFTLVLLSSTDPRALRELRQRLESSLQFRSSSLEELTFEDVTAPWQEPLERALAADAVRVAMRSPVWLSLDHGGLDAATNQLRDRVLAALNQYRTRLEREFRRPLLVALPTSYLPRVWEVAPDLWTIRGIVVDLAQPKRVVTRSWEPTTERRLELREPKPSDASALPAVVEWKRIAGRAAADPESVSPFVATAAAELVLEHGDLALAASIAEQGLALARARVAADSDSERKWNLMGALDVVGRVAMQRRNLEEAAKAFEESVAVSRQLMAEGSFPRSVAMRDLSVSLERVGDVAREQGRLEEAGKAFGESLEVSRNLVVEERNSPQALRDLGVSLDNVGAVARKLGRLDEAAKAFGESLEVRRRLVAEVGELVSPTTLRDVSASLERVGDIALEQGRPEEAAKAFEESLRVRQQLVVEESPTSLWDVSASLDRVGWVALVQGRIAEAAQVFEESLGVRRRLMVAMGANQQTLRGLRISLTNVAQVARAQGRTADAEQLLAEAEEVKRRLDALASAATVSPSEGNPH